MEKITKKRGRFLLFLVPLLAVFLAVGCSGGTKNSSGSQKLTAVTLNEVAHSIFYAPQYVAIEEGYFAEEGIDLTLVTGFGADKVMTAVLSGEADVGFMGSEASIYVYAQHPDDAIVNFAQLTQRAGNFLVAREPMKDFQWSDLAGKEVLGGRKGGMPQMVFEYILKKEGLDPATDLSIDQSIDFGSTAAAFSGGQETLRWNLNREPPPWNRRARALWPPPWVWTPAMCPIQPTAPGPASSMNTPS